MEKTVSLDMQRKKREKKKKTSKHNIPSHFTVFKLYSLLQVTKKIQNIFNLCAINIILAIILVKYNYAIDSFKLVYLLLK